MSITEIAQQYSAQVALFHHNAVKLMESSRTKKLVFILLITTVLLICMIIYISDHLVKKLTSGPEAFDVLMATPFLQS